MRFGSARILATEFDFRASRKSANCEASKMPKSVAVPVLVAVPVAVKLVVIGVRTPWTPVLVCVIGPAVPLMLAAPPIGEASSELSLGRNQLTPSSRIASRFSSAILTRSKTWRGPGTWTRLMIISPGWAFPWVPTPGGIWVVPTLTLVPAPPPPPPPPPPAPKPSAPERLPADAWPVNRSSDVIAWMISLIVFASGTCPSRISC